MTTSFFSPTENSITGAASIQRFFGAGALYEGRRLSRGDLREDLLRELRRYCNFDERNN